MNMLIDPLPKRVDIGGKSYEIRTDFRISILFEIMMLDPEVPDDMKVVNGLNLYYPKLPGDIEEACDKMLWFYKCGREDNAYVKKLAESKSEDKRVYSFDYDDDYIYAAFLRQYGIDLNGVKHLHWWKFKAMFNSLTDDNEFVKIMGYRAVDITKDMSKDQQRFYRKMKKIHEIPLPKSEQEKQDAITEALMNGGDLTGLL